MALLVGLAFTGGWFYALLRHPADDSAEAGFLRDMSVHHAQAVEMGMVGYDRAEAPEIKTLAYDIATMQQYQIGQMQTWLAEWNLSPVSPTEKMAWMPGGAVTVQNGLMPGMATNEELNRLKSATGRDFDILFSQLMLRHHLGGVHMAEEIVKLSDNEQVVDLAERILAGQRNEVRIFQDLLQRWGARTTP